MKRRLWLSSLVMLFVASPVFAILGIGDVVYDPSNFEEALQQLAQLEQQYRQLVQTYQMVQNQYQQMLRMAQQLPASLAARYRWPRTASTSASATDNFGNVSAWIDSINSGVGVATGYATATETLGTYDSAWDQIPAEQAPTVRAGYATVELTDGANLSALQTIGRVRGESAAADAAIDALENDSLSDAPSLNTEIAVLNKINAAGVVHLRATRDTNALLVALAEQHVMASKRERDTEAQIFNEHIAFVRDARAVMAAQAAGASDAMTSYRMP